MHWQANDKSALTQLIHEKRRAGDTPSGIHFSRILPVRGDEQLDVRQPREGAP